MESIAIGAASFLRNLFLDHNYLNHLSGMPMGTFGNRIKRARQDAELTRAQLSNMAGIPLSTITAIERGKVDNVSEETLLILAFLLKRAPGYLCG